MIKCLRKTLARKEVPEPPIVITGREKVLMNAIRNVFLTPNPCCDVARLKECYEKL
jgi:hypothetical protein